MSNPPGYGPVSASYTASTDTSSHGFNVMAQQSPVGSNYKQPLHQAPLPNSITHSGPRRSYVSSIRNYNEASQRRAAIISRNRVPVTSSVGLPKDDAERFRLAGMLFDAIYDISATLEEDTCLHYKYFMNDNRYPYEVVDVMCWRVLEHTEDAQRGRCHLPPWYTTAGPEYKAHASFNERFDCVMIALRRKVTNKNLNRYKNLLTGIGRQCVVDNEVNGNENGQLENGAKYGVKAQAPTATARLLGGRVKKRTAIPSQRARAIRKIDMAIETVAAGKMVAQAGKNTPCPPPSQAVPTSPAMGNAGCSLTQMSHVSSHATPAFPEGTSAEHQMSMRDQALLGPHTYVNQTTIPLAPELQAYQQLRAPEPLPPGYSWPHNPAAVASHQYEPGYGVPRQFPGQDAWPSHRLWSPSTGDSPPHQGMHPSQQGAYSLEPEPDIPAEGVESISYSDYLTDEHCL
ncbi:hypothetical protein F5Y10DRAFT_270104 [Nemania abortiva]|nr:hypothetical protein F5Y10DRAFT_270104 [Nemania abortiva]